MTEPAGIETTPDDAARVEAERDAAVENAKAYCDQWKDAVDTRRRVEAERDGLREVVEQIAALVADESDTVAFVRGVEAAIRGRLS